METEPHDELKIEEEITLEETATQNLVLVTHEWHVCKDEAREILQLLKEGGGTFPSPLPANAKRRLGTNFWGAAKHANLIVRMQGNGRGAQSVIDEEVLKASRFRIVPERRPKMKTYGKLRHIEQHRSDLWCEDLQRGLEALDVDLAPPVAPIPTATPETTTQFPRTDAPRQEVPDLTGAIEIIQDTINGQRAILEDLQRQVQEAEGIIEQLEANRHNLERAQQLLRAHS